LAIAGAALCALHCTLLPVALALAPALSLAVWLPEQFHLWVLIISAQISVLALMIGHRRHRKWMPLWIGLIGIALLASGLFLTETEASERVITLAGSLSLILGHWVNMRKSRQGRGQ
jgi:MerC mercury resistance protein